jgi:hypothetical protein
LASREVLTIIQITGGASMGDLCATSALALNALTRKLR